MPKHMIDEAAAADMSPLQARLLATYMNALEEQDDAPAATVTAPVPPPPEEEADAPAPQRTLSRSDLYARTMGDLLLKGWRMLGENCPETGEVPLMQHPVNGRKFSIATGRYTDEPAPATAEAERGPLFSATPTPKPESTPPPALPPAPPPAPPPATRPVPPPAAPAAVRESDEWCETMSKLMLQGWKMLNETCPVTGAVPLMGHPRNGRKFSVAIGKFVDEIGAGQSDAWPFRFFSTSIFMMREPSALPLEVFGTVRRPAVVVYVVYQNNFKTEIQNGIRDIKTTPANK